MKRIALLLLLLGVVSHVGHTAQIRRMKSDPTARLADVSKRVGNIGGRNAAEIMRKDIGHETLGRRAFSKPSNARGVRYGGSTVRKSNYVNSNNVMANTGIYPFPRLATPVKHEVPSRSKGFLAGSKYVKIYDVQSKNPMTKMGESYPFLKVTAPVKHEVPSRSKEFLAGRKCAKCNNPTARGAYPFPNLATPVPNDVPCQNNEVPSRNDGFVTGRYFGAVIGKLLEGLHVHQKCCEVEPDPTDDCQTDTNFAALTMPEPTCLDLADSTMPCEMPEPKSKVFADVLEQLEERRKSSCYRLDKDIDTEPDTTCQEMKKKKTSKMCNPLAGWKNNRGNLNVDLLTRNREDSIDRSESLNDAICADMDELSKHIAESERIIKHEKCTLKMLRAEYQRIQQNKECKEGKVDVRELNQNRVAEEKDMKKLYQNRNEGNEDLKELNKKKDAEKYVKKLNQNRNEVKEDLKELNHDRNEGQKYVKGMNQDQNEGQKDEKELNQDQNEGKEDMKELNQDRNEGQMDVKELNQDQNEGQKDVKELNQDQDEGQKDVKELNQDEDEGQKDLKELYKDQNEGQKDVKKLYQNQDEGQEDVKELNQVQDEGQKGVKELNQDQDEGQKDVKELTPEPLKRNLFDHSLFDPHDFISNGGSPSDHEQMVRSAKTSKRRHHWKERRLYKGGKYSFRRKLYEDTKKQRKNIYKKCKSSVHSKMRFSNP